MKLCRFLMSLGVVTLAAGVLACSNSLNDSQGPQDERQQSHSAQEKARQEQIMEEQQREPDEPGER